MTHKLTERADPAAQAVVTLLRAIGEDPTRSGLAETPERFVKALHEMTAGYRASPENILKKFPEPDWDGTTAYFGIPFTSLCEHHVLAFTGTVDFAYLPRDNVVVGLSKMARLVDCFAMRLQTQERMTREIAEAFAEFVPNLGVACVVRAAHACAVCRGVRKPGAEFVTCKLTGQYLINPAARAEFFSLRR